MIIFRRFLRIMICSKEEARIIYNASWISLFGSLIQYFYYNTPDLSLGTFAVFLSSISYWRYPLYGCRRNIDMLTVLTVFIYYFYASLNPFYNSYPYYFFTGTGLYCSSLGYKEHTRGNTKKAAYLHALLHVFANIGNISLSISQQPV